MAKFTIYEGRAFNCVFPIKQPDSPTPMDLTGASATFTLSTIDSPVCVALNKIPMSIYGDAVNGKFALSLTSEQTTGLVTKNGFEEDKYQTMATYKVVIEINHPTYGQIFARIPAVYIESMGDVCNVV